MDGQSDPEVTPRPLRLTRNADIADRTPYIPRRKSSVGKRDGGGSYQDLPTMMVLGEAQKPIHIWPKYHNSVKKSHIPKEERTSSRASVPKVDLPSNMYGAVSFPHLSKSTGWNDQLMLADLLTVSSGYAVP